MANFLKSFFGGKAESPQDEKERKGQKNFEIFKYDGIRALRMGRADYAIRCFHEALAIRKDMETMDYLANTLIQTHELEEARTILEEMTSLWPEESNIHILLANVYFMLEDYTNMKNAATKAQEQATENPAAYLLMAKAEHGLQDEFNAIAHLTTAIQKKDDYTDARLLRAKILMAMQQNEEAKEDVEAILAANPEDENALFLQGQLKERQGDSKGAQDAYTRIIEANPFSEQANLHHGT